MLNEEKTKNTGVEVRDITIETLHYENLEVLDKELKEAFAAEYDANPVLRVEEVDIENAKRLLRNFLDFYAAETKQRLENAKNDWEKIKILFGVLNRFMARFTKPRELNRENIAAEYKNLREAIGIKMPHTKCNVFNYAYIKLFPMLAEILEHEYVNNLVTFSWGDYYLYNPLDTHQMDYNQFNHHYAFAMIQPAGQNSPEVFSIDPYWGSRSQDKEDISEIDYTQFRKLAAILTFNFKKFQKQFAVARAYFANYDNLFRFHQLDLILKDESLPHWLRFQAAEQALDLSLDGFSFPHERSFDSESVEKLESDKKRVEYMGRKQEIEVIDAKLHAREIVEFDRWQAYKSDIKAYANEICDEVVRLLESPRQESQDSFMDLLAFANLARAITVYFSQLVKINPAFKDLRNSIFSQCERITRMIFEEKIPFSQREIAVLRRRGIGESVLSSVSLYESSDVSSKSDSQVESHRHYFQVRSLITVLWLANVADNPEAVRLGLGKLKRSYEKSEHYAVFISEVLNTLKNFSVYFPEDKLLLVQEALRINS